MKAYKFFHPGRVAPFTGHVWPEQSWLEAAGPLETCRSGIHACRVDQLPYWLADELWEVELTGEIESAELQVLARRGRLVRLVEQWDGAARSEFATECVRRAAGYASDELRAHGLVAEADALAGAKSLAGLTARATAASKAAAAVAGAGDAVDLAGYVVDAAAYAEAEQTAGAAFVAAHAAVVHAPAGVDDPFGAERAGQAEWLRARLDLSEDAG
jgi:hypothetical protein